MTDADLNRAVAEARPIETAPKEGRLLLFDGEWYIGWWNPKQGWTTIGYVGHGESDFMPLSPDYWLPLPPNPKGATNVS
jgi:hypothetical protein